MLISDLIEDKKILNYKTYKNYKSKYDMKSLVFYHHKKKDLSPSRPKKNAPKQHSTPDTQTRINNPQNEK